ncbi:MAG: transcriptional regulator, AraC family [Bacteroidetes bacterium]|jgi:AraC-like DNA-binding protein|nr:transcriptional regulator, AraC family [Bacteroidota bacterium]MDF2450940.1 transcriptional regulator, AraC family [Bacteroidota bacterium]
MKKQLPVYKIQHFREAFKETDFYANSFRSHIHQHTIATAPHKHDFFLVVLFTKGSGTHEIDFITYPVKPGYIFLMAPGQMHNWSLSPNADGYIFFHTESFYDKAFTLSGIRDYPFFDSSYHVPFLHLSKKDIVTTETLFKKIVREYKSDELMKFAKLHALLSLVYIELTRHYSSGIKIENQSYLHKLRKAEKLIDSHYKTKKYPQEYADLMHMSEKHLNRICKECLNKTTRELIAERIVLEAKRMLIHSKYTIKEVALELGYDDNSYFSRFFKKNTDETPLAFLNRYK